MMIMRLPDTATMSIQIALNDDPNNQGLKWIMISVSIWSFEW